MEKKNEVKEWKKYNNIAWYLIQISREMEIKNTFVWLSIVLNCSANNVFLPSSLL